MKIIGFNYTKISAERQQKIEKTEKITQNIEFTNVEKDELDLMKESNLLRVSFLYTLEYEPKNITITLEGSTLIHTSPENIKQAIKTWKKKQIEEQLRISLLRIILNKCTLKALALEEELNVPHHMNLVQINNPS